MSRRPTRNRDHLRNRELSQQARDLSGDCKRPKKRKTAFRWMGSKGKLTPHLLPYFPYHVRYISVFGGSAADLIVKPRSTIEIYNDINHIVVNFFDVLRDRCQRRELTYRLLYTPRSRFEFSRCHAILQEPVDDPLEVARAFFYCTLYSYGGRDPSNERASYTATAKYRWGRIADHLDEVADRFRYMLVENLSWEQLLTKYDADETFFYLDPPYLPSTRHTDGDYRHEMSEQDHIAMLTALQHLRGLVMLSGYPSALYEEHLSRWRRLEFEMLCSISPAKKKPKRTEVVWMNYDSAGCRIKTA